MNKKGFTLIEMVFIGFYLKNTDFWLKLAYFWSFFIKKCI